ncbi:MAG TPA: hypothetical protein VIA06_19375 [Candidatus Dormibacteraeota bacterium]|jgi:hypothetical protein|nr:hypothetical protein [Candidatus Dormibacteraeota bacterium]
MAYGWRRILTRLQTRVESAEQYLGAQEGATRGDFLAAQSAPTRLSLPRRGVVAGLVLIIIVVISIAAVSLWQSRPTEPAPRLSANRMTDFAMAERLSCQPPQVNPVAQHWYCASGSRHLALDWYVPASGRVVTIDAYAGPGIDQGGASAYFNRVLALTEPSDQLGNAELWTRANLENGQGTEGPDSLTTSVSGARYTLSIQLD